METSKQLSRVAANQKMNIWRDRITSLLFVVSVVVGYGVVESAARTLLSDPVSEAVASVTSSAPATRA